MTAIGRIGRVTEGAAGPVLLTGARGFVGRAVLAELSARRIPVFATSRRAGPALPGVTWLTADLLDPADRARLIAEAPAARLIHCAWEVEHGAFWTSPQNALWRAASREVIARFSGAGGRRIVALGTCAEYDPLAPGGWDETRPIAPDTPYGIEKAGFHADLQDVPGLVWARLFHLYGPGEDARRLVPALIAALREGRPAEIRAAELIRDYASTAHVARCLVALMDSAASGAVDIGSGHAVPLGEIGRILARLMGREDLLRLSHRPGPNDPAVMAPRLARLHASIGPLREDPRAGLAALPGLPSAPDFFA